MGVFQAGVFQAGVFQIDSAAYAAFLADATIETVVLAHLFPEERVTALTRRVNTSSAAPRVLTSTLSLPLGSGSSFTMALPANLNVDGDPNAAGLLRVYLRNSGVGLPAVVAFSLDGVVVPLSLLNTAAVGTAVRIYAYQLPAPLTLGTTPRTLGIALTGVAYCAMVVDIFKGCSAAVPFSAGATASGGSGTAPSVTASPASNQLLVDVLGIDTLVGSYDPVNQTEMLPTVGASFTGKASYQQGVFGAPIASEWPTVAANWAQLAVIANPGQSPVWEAPLSDVVAADVVPGGVFVEVIGATLDGVALALADDLAEEEFAPGSWRMDRAAGVLQLHAPDSLRPADVLAQRKVRLSNAHVVFPNQPLYYPWIAGAVPEILADATQPVAPTFPVSSGSLAAANAHAFWDRLSREWLWVNRGVELIHGGGEMGFSEYQPLAALQIVNLAPGDQLCTWRLRAGGWSDIALPRVTWSEADAQTPWGANHYSPLISALSSGVSILPVGYGQIFDAPLLLAYDLGTGVKRYVLCWCGPFGAPDSVTVYASQQSTGQRVTLSAAGGNYVVNSGIDIRVTAPWNDGTWVLTADFLYRPGGEVVTFGRLAELLLADMGVTAIDAASIAKAKTDQPHELGVYLPGGEFPSTPALRKLSEVAIGCLARVYVDTRGRFAVAIWDPTADHADAPHLHGYDFAVWTPTVKLEALASGVALLYARREAENSYAQVTITDPETRREAKVAATAQVTSYFTTAEAAALLASRHLARLSQPTTTVEIEGVSPKLLLPLSAGDVVQVTRDRAPSPTGRYDRERMEALQVRKQVSPPRVSATLGDMSGLRARYRRWADASLSALTYSTADEAQRKTYMFWADSDEEVGGSDADVFRWW